MLRWPPAGSTWRSPRPTCETVSSTAPSSEQVPGTLDKWYKDYERVIVVTVDPAPLTSEVKWEPNAVGVLFPHIYGPIVPEAVAEAVALDRDGSGRFQPTGEEI